MRHRLRREDARRDQEPERRRHRGDHRRADAGHGRQRHPAAGLSAGRARDRERPRRALHRRRDDHGLRPHRQVLGRRSRRRRARRHDRRQGHRRRLPAGGRHLDGRADEGASRSPIPPAAPLPTAATRSASAAGLAALEIIVGENLVGTPRASARRCSRGCGRCRRSTASSATSAARVSCSASSS